MFNVSFLTQFFLSWRRRRRKQNREKKRKNVQIQISFIGSMGNFLCIKKHNETISTPLIIHFHCITLCVYVDVKAFHFQYMKLRFVKHIYFDSETWFCVKFYAFISKLVHTIPNGIPLVVSHIHMKRKMRNWSVNKENFNIVWMTEKRMNEIIRYFFFLFHFLQIIRNFIINHSWKLIREMKVSK